jgi:WD40 repeat protein
MRTLFTVAGRVQQLAFNPAGTRLIAYEGGWLREWDLTTGQALPIRRVIGWPTRLEFSMNAYSAAYSFGSNVFILRGIGNGGFDHEATSQHFPSTHVPLTIALSPDAESFATATLQQVNPLLLRPLTHDEALFTAEESPTIQRPQIGTMIELSSLDGRTRRNLRSSVRVRAVAFSPNKLLLVSGGDGGLTIWDLANGESIAVWSGPRVDRVLFAPDADSVAVLTSDALHLRRAVTGKAIYALETNSGKPFADLAFSPDGRILATSVGNMVQFWDAAAGEPLRGFDWSIGNVTALAFAPDGLTAAAGSDRGQIVIWDVDA